MKEKQGGNQALKSRKLSDFIDQSTYENMAIDSVRAVCHKDVNPNPKKLKNGEGTEVQVIVRHLRCFEGTERGQAILKELATALKMS